MLFNCLCAIGDPQLEQQRTIGVSTSWIAWVTDSASMGALDDSSLLDLDAALDALGRFNPELSELVDLHDFAGLEFECIAGLRGWMLKTSNSRVSGLS